MWHLATHMAASQPPYISKEVRSYRRNSHVLKHPDVLIRGVTTFLKPGGEAKGVVEIVAHPRQAIRG